MAPKTESPRVRYERLLARLRHLQMYNRMDAQGLKAGRAAARAIGKELRAAAADLPRQRSRRK